MAQEITQQVDELNETIVETLRRVGVAPIPHFANVVAGKSLCVLCHGDRTVSEIVYTLHCSKSMAFEMLKKLEDSIDHCPCPECYGRGYVYSDPDRQDRAAAVLLNNMPVIESDTMPSVYRLHKTSTLEEAWKLDKEMNQVMPDDTLDAEYTVSLDDDEALLDEMIGEEEEIEREVFWSRPDEDLDVTP